jgi:AsmA protein
VKPSNAVPVNLKLIGPAWSPSVSDLDLKPAVNQIVKEGGSALVGRAVGVDSSKVQGDVQKKAEEEQKKIQDEAKNRLKGLFGK